VTPGAARPSGRRPGGGRLARAASALVAAGALAACSGDPKAGGDSAAVPNGPPRPAGDAAAAGRGAAGPDTSACPHDGRWRACSVVERLDQSGLVPRVDSAAPASRVPFLAAPGRRIALGRGALLAFVYDDTARAARDVAALDTVRVAPRGESYSWDVPPTLVRSANLVAVLLMQNEHQIERVRLALEAGPPQRNPDRP
jgi:hypothetical protein